MASHNIKVLSIFGRYVMGLTLLYSIFDGYLSPAIPIFGILLYSYWAYGKVVLKTGSWRAGLWGVTIQYTSDFAVMAGFLRGILSS